MEDYSCTNNNKRKLWKEEEEEEEEEEEGLHLNKKYARLPFQLPSIGSSSSRTTTTTTAKVGTLQESFLVTGDFKLEDALPSESPSSSYARNGGGSSGGGGGRIGTGWDVVVGCGMKRETSCCTSSGQTTAETKSLTASGDSGSIRGKEEDDEEEDDDDVDSTASTCHCHNISRNIKSTTTTTRRTVVFPLPPQLDDKGVDDDDDDDCNSRGEGCESPASYEQKENGTTRRVDQSKAKSNAGGDGGGSEEEEEEDKDKDDKPTRSQYLEAILQHMILLKKRGLTSKVIPSYCCNLISNSLLLDPPSSDHSDSDGSLIRGEPHKSNKNAFLNKDEGDENHRPSSGLAATAAVSASGGSGTTPHRHEMTLGNQDQEEERGVHQDQEEEEEDSNTMSSSVMAVQEDKDEREYETKDQYYLHIASDLLEAAQSSFKKKKKPSSSCIVEEML